MFARRSLWMLVMAAWLAPSAARAANPSLGAITPYGGQRGTELEVLFQGGNLGDAQEILLYYPGITVTHFEVVNDATVKTRLQIAADCRLGIHAMRVRTATGISNLRTFSVGALRSVAEAEPNNEFTAPQPIDMDVTVEGRVDNEDVDYFAVPVQQGERLSVEIEGIRLGNTFFDPYVAILNSERFELASCDDAALTWQDASSSIVAPEAGTYTIQVRESAYGGNGACNYRLHVGRYPRPRAVLPAGGRPGETLQVRWLGDVGGERVEQVALPAARLSPFGLEVRDALGVAPWPMTFVLSDLPNVLEAEPNANAATATACEVPAALNGAISEPGDVDVFRFPVKAGQAFDVRVMARAIRTELDPVVTIHRGDGAGIAGNDDSGGPDAYVRFSAPADDTYTLVIRDHLGKGRPDYVYRVEVKPVQPSLVMGLPERQQYVDVTASVPQGNRTAFLVSASRADFGGPVQVELAGLPPGVSFETVPMPANQAIVPVVLTAAADAPLAGALVDVIGRYSDGNISVEGHLQQTTGLVRGQNNILVWGHTADRMATAVTAAAPFSIQVVPPKAPIVRDGSMGLRVAATRSDGFTAPIAVRLLYNPPGIGSAGDVVIPEGQNEAVIPITANGGAELGTWKIVVLGEATVGNGPILVSSPLVDLQVAEPFVAFAFQAAACEKGQETDVVISITRNREFQGNATVELLGLPHEVTAEPREFSADTTELVFRVKTTANSPVGRHRTLLCRAVFTVEGEPVVHTLGTGELRIDEPLPPKADPPPPQPEPTPMPQPMPEKRLSRLEQLRLERERALKNKQQSAP
ncbi:MAG: PPC domain-containing protein [Pirellulales bacterium]|nr:PPC domain-containing protein [Pirellulales bacterium]